MKEWNCDCGNVVYSNEYPHFPQWADGHRCSFREKGVEIKKDGFIEKLIAFKNAAYELLETWEKLDHTGDYYAGKYPFDKSYDEVCNDISTWLEAQQESGGIVVV